MRVEILPEATEAKFGAPGPKLVEPTRASQVFYKRIQDKPKVEKLYSMQWRRETLDLAELATKRYLEGWAVSDLCQHFGRSEDSIQWAYLMLKKRNFQHKSISEGLKKMLTKATASMKKGKRKNV